MSRLEYLRPSGAATWIVCQGAVLFRELYPELPEDQEANEVQQDGIAAHWLANEIANNRFPALDSISPNGRILDNDMFDAVDDYLGVIFNWPNVVPVCEQAIPCDVIYPGMRGTPDAWAYDPTTRTLYVADLKYGFKFVEVWENYQLIIYAAALIDLLKIDGLADQKLNVVFTIVQPRCSHRDGPIRTWRIKASDMRAIVNQLKYAAQMAMGPTPACVPNPGCGDCVGRISCEALQNSALNAVEQSYQAIPFDPTPQHIGNELRLLEHAHKLLEARIDGLKVQGNSAIRKGRIVPGYVLATTYARETWREGTESQVLGLAPFYNTDVAAPLKPISPAQARKKLPADVVAMFAHKPSTGVRLTKEDKFAAHKAFSSTTE